MKNFAADRYGYNKILVKGYVFSHNLEIRTYQNSSKDNFGDRYISGVINVAIDEDAVASVPVHVNFMNEKFKSGDTNESFTILEGLINTNNTVTSVGKENALRVDIQGTVEDNTFYSTKNSVMVESQQLRASYVHVQSGAFKGCASWQTDMLIHTYAEIDPDNGDEPYGELRGFVFNYRNEFMPVKYKVRKASGGMDYFASKDISAKNPLLTRVFGDYVVTTVTSNRTIETAFGAPSIEPTTYSRESWDVSGAAVQEYDFGDENVMTLEDVNRLMEIRNEYVAERKAYAENRAAQSAPAKTASNPGFAATAAVEADIAAGSYVF